MRRLLGVVAVTVLATSAMAADVGRPVYKAAPAPAFVPFTWSGFYIGGNLGVAWTDSNNFAFGIDPVVGSVLGPLTVLSRGDSSANFLLGGQIGYNWQAGAVVFGVEADGSWLNREGRDTLITFGPGLGTGFGSVAGDNIVLRRELEGLFTLRGRLGYAPGPWMWYVTGGLAGAGLQHELTATAVRGGVIFERSFVEEDTRWGWTIGTGVEFALSNNWSIGAEYLYMDFGTRTLNHPALAGAALAAGSPAFGVGSADFEDRLHVIRAKLNYRF